MKNPKLYIFHIFKIVFKNYFVKFYYLNLRLLTSERSPKMKLLAGVVRPVAMAPKIPMKYSSLSVVREYLY